LRNARELAKTAPLMHWSVRSSKASCCGELGQAGPDKGGRRRVVSTFSSLRLPCSGLFSNDL